MTDPLDAMKARWNHIQGSLFPWLRQEVEPMTELLGRLGERRRVAPKGALQCAGIDAVQDEPQARVIPKVMMFDLYAPNLAFRLR